MSLNKQLNFNLKTFLVFLLLFILCYNTRSQFKGFPSDQTDKLMQEDISSKISQDKLSGTEKFPIGNIVMPDYYKVGPGDILIMQNLTASISNEVLTVTPENTLLIPRVGIISVTGMTLTELRKKIISTIKTQNPNAVVAVSLYQPRNIIVNFSGNVVNTGTFTLPASYRVSTALQIANQIMANKQSPQEISEILSINQKKKNKEKYFENSGLPALFNFINRNINVIHLDGTTIIADLEAAKATTDLKYDPYLQEGDLIIVPNEPENFPEISISGAVIRPCRMPFKRNDKLNMLLKFGYGLKDDADINNIYLVNSDGAKEKISVDSNLNLLSGNIDLKPGASVFVGQLSGKIYKTGIVAVSGNVANPGTYSITPGETKLTDVVTRAGGFTEDAYLPLSYVMRKERENNNDYSPNRIISENFQYSDLSLQDTTRFFLDITNRKPYVSCDFVAAFKQNSTKDNIALQDGDMIVVPSNPKNVYVYGQVSKPGYILYQPGKPLEWYIESAGGYAISAEKSKSRIIDGKTKVWKKYNDNISINAGDEIYVPKPSDQPPGTEIQQYALIVSIISSLALIINIAFNIIKYK